MEFKQRSRWESPIFLRMLQDSKTVADEIHAMEYGDKVEAFRDSGMVTITELPYEGPDLSPGADRPNCMGRGGLKMQRPTTAIYTADGKSGGRRVVPLIHDDSLEFG